MKTLNILSGKTDISPRDAGFIPSKLNELDNLFLGLIEKSKLQGASYLISRNGKIFGMEIDGKADQ